MNCFQAALSNNTIEVLNYLRDGNVNICDSNGASLLHYAARGNAMEVANILIHNYININICDSNGETAIFEVVRTAKLGFIKLLLRYHANINIVNNFGESLLFRAIIKGNQDVIDLLLKANMTDHRNDCILTLCTLISILFSLINIYWIDGMVGIIISAWIFFTGIKIFIESYNVLMDKSLDIHSKEIILDLINTYTEIKRVAEINSTPVGYQYIVTITIHIDGNMSTFESHRIADDLEKNIESMDNIAHAIIHVNPV